MLLKNGKELDNRIRIYEYGIGHGKRTFRLEFRLPSILTEPPFCMDTIRLWIPTSLEEENETSRAQKIRTISSQCASASFSTGPKPTFDGGYWEQTRQSESNYQTGNGKPSSSWYAAQEPPKNTRTRLYKLTNWLTGPPQNTESENNSEALDEDPHSSMDMATTSILKMPLLAINCSVQACDKSFASQDELRWDCIPSIPSDLLLKSSSRHRRYHDRPEQCPGCPKRFGTKTHLDRHINDVHLTTKAFYCSVVECQYSKGSSQGKVFPRKANLARHMRARHRDDPTVGNSLENEPSGIANAGGSKEKKTVEVGLTTFVRF